MPPKSKNPKRDREILRRLSRGQMPKEIAFALKLQSVGVVYELLRRHRLNAYVLRRESRLLK